MDETPSIAGVFLQDVRVGGDLTISGVTIQLPRELPSLWANIPPLPNHFLGRDDLVDDLVQRLIAGHSPALSAEGLPGVGKTTLAVVLAHNPAILAHFAGDALIGPFLGVWMSMVAVQNAPVGIASTLMALPPILLIPLSAWAFGERITGRAVVGTAVALGGAALIFLL